MTFGIRYLDPDRWSISTSSKLRCIYLIAHIGLIPATLLGNWMWWVLSIAVYLFVQTFAFGIGTHRFFAHQAFQTSRPKELFFIYSSVFHVLGSPLSWAGLHSLHHTNAEEKLDPHSPHHIPWYKIWLSLDYSVPGNANKRTIKRFITDPHHVFVHRHYLKLILLWMIALWAIDIKWFLFVFCVPVVLLFNVTTLGTILLHVHGYRNHNTPCKSKNSLLVSFLTLGDGWHNNHHWQPQNWYHGEKWWEWDLQGFFIKYFFIRSSEK